MYVARALLTASTVTSAMAYHSHHGLYSRAAIAHLDADAKLDESLLARSASPFDDADDDADDDALALYARDAESDADDILDAVEVLLQRRGGGASK